MARKSSSLPVVALASLVVCTLASGAETTSAIGEGTEAQAGAQVLEPAPAGERLSRQAMPSTASTTTRAERKAEAQQALRNGQLITAADSTEHFDQSPTRRPSTRTRADRMAATLAAAKAHQLSPAGEKATQPDR